MPTNKYSSSVPNFLILLVSVVSIVAFAFVFRWVSVSSANELPLSQSFHSSPEQRTGVIESEVITATRRGFEPAEIKRPEGKFILMVDNRSGSELNFRFSRVTGERLREITSSREELDWNDVVDLGPGTYVLTERDHPDWNCSITITAR